MPKTNCDVCLSQNVIYTHRKESSANHTSGWPMIWLCLSCRASVGCHPDSDRPLGLMATRYTRQLRREAHLYFDKIHRCGFMSRPRAYRWATTLLRTTGEFHISRLTNVNLEKLIEHSIAYLEKKGVHKLQELHNKEWDRQHRELRKTMNDNARQKKRRKKR